MGNFVNDSSETNSKASSKILSVSILRVTVTSFSISSESEYNQSRKFRKFREKIE